MALPVIRKSDRHRLVHTTDDDVTLPPGEWCDGWVSVDTPGLVVGPGATVVEIRPLDALEVTACICYEQGKPAAHGYLGERILAARKGMVSITPALPEGAEMPQPILVSIGTAILDISLGHSRPFDLRPIPQDESETSPSGDSPESGSGATPSPSTAQRPGASPSAPTPKGSMARSGSGRAARGGPSLKDPKRKR